MVIAPKGDSPRRALVASGQTILSADGEKLGAVVAMRDVTEERQAQRELARLAAIVEFSHDAILGATLDGTLVSWNAGAERLYGYSAAEVIGRHVSLLDTPVIEGPIPGVIARLRKGQTIDPIDITRTHKDGTVFHAVLSFSPIKDERGRMIGLSCIAHDTTARAEARKHCAGARHALPKPSGSPTSAAGDMTSPKTKSPGRRSCSACLRWTRRTARRPSRR